MTALLLFLFKYILPPPKRKKYQRVHLYFDACCRSTRLRCSAPRPRSGSGRARYVAEKALRMPWWIQMYGFFLWIQLYGPRVLIQLLRSSLWIYGSTYIPIQWHKNDIHPYYITLQAYTICNLGYFYLNE